MQTQESLLLPALRPPPSGTPLTTSFRPALRRLSVPRHHLKCARTRCPLLKTSPSSLLTQGPTAPGTVPLPSTPLQPHSDREPQRPATPPGAATSLINPPGRSRTLSWCPGQVAQRRQPGELAGPHPAQEAPPGTSPGAQGRWEEAQPVGTPGWLPAGREGASGAKVCSPPGQIPSRPLRAAAPSVEVAPAPR